MFTNFYTKISFRDERKELYYDILFRVFKNKEKIHHVFGKCEKRFTFILRIIIYKNESSNNFELVAYFS